MPHRRSLLVAARRIACSALSLSVVACAREGRVTVVIDTTGSGGTLEVLALPVDPATIAAGADSSERPSRGTPRADSIARFVAARDSAATFDEGFQRERAALNAEAERIASMDRTSAEYARAWDAHRTRFVDAERMRTARDRLRERETTLRTRLGAAAPPDDSTRRARALAARREALAAAGSGERRAEEARVRAGRVTLELEPGTWWLGVAREDAVPTSFTRIDVRARAHDTVQLRR